MTSNNSSKLTMFTKQRHVQWMNQMLMNSESRNELSGDCTLVGNLKRVLLSCKSALSRHFWLGLQIKTKLHSTHRTRKKLALSCLAAARNGKKWTWKQIFLPQSSGFRTDALRGMKQLQTICTHVLSLW